MAKETTAALVERILGNPRANEELKRKIRYCQEQIQAGRDDALLIQRRRELVAEARRAGVK